MALPAPGKYTPAQEAVPWDLGGGVGWTGQPSVQLKARNTCTVIYRDPLGDRLSWRTGLHIRGEIFELLQNLAGKSSGWENVWIIP